MSGYNEFSKSNNAVAAENGGRFPASKLARIIGVDTGAIKSLLKPCEWHHTSKLYNPTYYYSQDDAGEIIAELKAWRAPAKVEVEYHSASGVYLEWGGTRAHPVANEIKFGPCRVTKKGKWFTLHTASGPIRKGEATRGFELSDASGNRLN